MIPRRRLILLAMASSAALMVGAGPAAATHSADHTAAEIAQVVSQAEDDSDGIVSEFASDLSNLSDEASVDDAEDAALAAVDSVWETARTRVDALADLYPSDLGQARGAAKQQLQDIRLTARTTISELAAEWTPPAPTTTTTTKPSTTTTSTTTTTTTPTTPASNGVGPGPNSGGGPGSNSGGEPGSNSGDGPEDRGGATRVPPPNSEPSDPSGDGSGPQDVPGSIMVLELAAVTPDQPFTVSSEAIGSLLAAQDTGATATLAAMLDTVLSPAVVDLVLSPLLILEILLRTLLDGGSSLIGPLTMFAIAAMALFAYDRFAKRNLSLYPI